MGKNFQISHELSLLDPSICKRVLDERHYLCLFHWCSCCFIVDVIVLACSSRTRNIKKLISHASPNSRGKKIAFSFPHMVVKLLWGTLLGCLLVVFPCEWQNRLQQANWSIYFYWFPATLNLECNYKISISWWTVSFVKITVTYDSTIYWNQGMMVLFLVRGDENILFLFSHNLLRKRAIIFYHFFVTWFVNKICHINQKNILIFAFNG